MSTPRLPSLFQPPATNTLSSSQPHPPYIPAQEPSLPISDFDADSVLTGGIDADAGGDAWSTSGYIPDGPSPSAPVPVADPFWLVGTDGNRVMVSDPSGIPKGIQSLQMQDGSSAVITPGGLSEESDDPQDRSRLYASEDELIRTYSGSDMRAIIEIADPFYAPAPNGTAQRKQLIELTTLSVSVHRVKTPARSCGYINPRGFARGGRTIAGTLVLTQFTVDLMYRFLLDHLMIQDLSKDSFYLKPDQLPPFDVTLIFCDEHGNSSYRRLLGVDCATDGTVYSVNDMFSEQTISYYAADFTPLMPLNRTALTRSSQVEKTPMSMLSKPAAEPIPSVDSTVHFGMELS